MTEFSWTALYKRALGLGRDEFIAGNREAAEALRKRLYSLREPVAAADRRELREIYLALSDLSVLRTSFEHHSSVLSPDALG